MIFLRKKEIKKAQQMYKSVDITDIANFFFHRYSHRARKESRVKKCSEGIAETRKRVVNMTPIFLVLLMAIDPMIAQSHVGE